MSAHVIRGNALALPLADNSVDLVVTSPPYFALRSYQDGGEHYAGQIGSEATPAEFVDALIAATREMVRVVKPSGSIWVNLGDSYAGQQSGPQGATGQRADRASANEPHRAAATLRSRGPRAKSLRGVPWRYALRCIDDLGLILRAEVIWSKPNGLPESVTDRVRRSHEVWFHFTREPRYYSAVDEIREAYDPGTERRYRTGGFSTRTDAAQITKGYSSADGGPKATNPLGKLPGSVWEIATEPLKVPDHLGIDHFAAFPTEWPRRIIQGWSPSGVCTVCGEGRRPVVVTDLGVKERKTPLYDATGKANHGNAGSTLGSRGTSATITGYACACTPFHTEDDGSIAGPVKVYDWHLWHAAPTTPAVVLDPFGGTGTTALVAKALGRHGISVDMSADYCRLAKWRTTDEGEMARAMQVKKPEKQVDGQVSMFDLLEGGGAA